MNDKTFAFIQYTEMPGLRAHSVLVAKTCKAMTELGYECNIVTPEKPEKEYKGNENIYDFYNLGNTSLTLHSVKGLQFCVNHTIGKLLGPLRHTIITFIFALQSWIYVYRNRIGLVQTSDPEVLSIFNLLKAVYYPKIIFDVHVTLPSWVTGSILRTANLIVVNCQYFKNDVVKRGVADKKVIELYNGIDPNEYNDLPSQKEIRLKLGLPANMFLIGYIGRFETMGIEKGIFGLINVLAKLKEKNIGILLVGGPETLANQYKSLAKKLGILSEKLFIYEQVQPTQVPMYTKACDLGWLVYPRHEHFINRMSPMKAMELIASKVPIIASDFPSLQEVLNKDVACFVDPDSVYAQQQTILSLLSNSGKYEYLKKGMEQFELMTWKRRQKIILSKLNL